MPTELRRRAWANASALPRAALPTGFLRLDTKRIIVVVGIVCHRYLWKAFSSCDRGFLSYGTERFAVAGIGRWLGFDGVAAGGASGTSPFAFIPCCETMMASSPTSLSVSWLTDRFMEGRSAGIAWSCAAFAAPLPFSLSLFGCADCFFSGEVFAPSAAPSLELFLLPLTPFSFPFFPCFPPLPAAFPPPLDPAAVVAAQPILRCRFKLKSISVSCPPIFKDVGLSSSLTLSFRSVLRWAAVRSPRVRNGTFDGSRVCLQGRGGRSTRIPLCTAPLHSNIPSASCGTSSARRCCACWNGWLACGCHAR